MAAGTSQRSSAGDTPIDENLWTQNVVDLHRVMGVAHSLYLILEHNNEAVLRVAMEIVTCRQSRKCLWWQDSWYADDDKREGFRTTVRETMTKVLAFAKGMPLVKRSPDDIADAASIAELRAQLEAAESAAAAALQREQALEMKCRVADEAAEESTERITTLERRMETMRQARKRGSADVHGADLASRIAELEEQVKAGELQRKELKARLGDGSESVDQTSPSHYGGKAGLTLLESGHSSPSMKRAHGQFGFASPKAFPVLEQQLEAERSRSNELEAERDRANAELDALRQELTAMKSRAGSKDLVQGAEDVLSLTQDTDGVANGRHQPLCPGGSKECSAEKERLLSDSRELDKVKEKLSKRDATISQLREEKEKLEEERMRMLRTLNQLRERLNRVTEIAKRRGCGDLIQEILDESKTTDTLNSEEFGCFHRLYEDALRRQNKMKDAERERMGIGRAEPREAQTQEVHSRVANLLCGTDENPAAVHHEQSASASQWVSSAAVAPSTFGDTVDLSKTLRVVDVGGIADTLGMSSPAPFSSPLMVSSASTFGDRQRPGTSPLSPLTATSAQSTTPFSPQLGGWASSPLGATDAFPQRSPTRTWAGSRPTTKGLSHTMSAPGELPQIMVEAFSPVKSGHRAEGSKRKSTNVRSPGRHRGLVLGSKGRWGQHSPESHGEIAWETAARQQRRRPSLGSLSKSGALVEGVGAALPAMTPAFTLSEARVLMGGAACDAGGDAHEQLLQGVLHDALGPESR